MFRHCVIVISILVTIRANDLDLDCTDDLYGKFANEDVFCGRSSSQTRDKGIAIQISLLERYAHDCQIPNGKFECKLAGRFADYLDESCQKYYVCLQRPDDTFEQRHYKCLSSLFDPKTLECSIDYKCPCREKGAISKNVRSFSESLSTCVTPSLGYEFRCKANGRFADLYDMTCTKYFLCHQLYNGTFIKKQYSCPRSAFHPLLGRCQMHYTCPCDGSLTTQDYSSTTTGTTEKISPPSTTPGYICDGSDQIDDWSSFECQQTGRFPDFTDSTCRRYYLCSHLHNGSFIKTPYSCPGSSCMDPHTSKCSLACNCPCTSTTTERTSSLSTTPGYICDGSDHIDDGLPFECQQTGRFPDFTDSTCRRYYLCSHLHNGSFIKTPYSCPGSSCMDPHTSKCSLACNCPCTSTTTERTSSPSTTPGYICDGSDQIDDGPPFECHQSGRFPDFTDSTCRRYYLCSHLHNGSFIKTPYSCPGSSCMDPHTSKCSLACNCPCTSTTTERTSSPSTTPGYICDGSDQIDDGPPFECHQTGRFPDFTDSTCRRYYLCSHLHNGSFIKTPYSCPGSSCMDPHTSKCSLACNCPCTSTTTERTSPPSTTPGYICDGSDHIDDGLPFECQQTGRFPDFTDSTCRRYYLCSHLHNGSFIKTPYSCPGSSCMDPHTSKCSLACNCPCTSTTTERTSSPSITPGYICDGSDHIDDGLPFECQQTGRFPDFTDSTCRRYYLCSHLHNGSFIKTPYSCPGSSCMDPHTSKCSLACNCPCTSTTTERTSPPSTTPGYICDGSDHIDDGLPFECQQTGRFPDFTDSTCRRYFLCSHLHNGSFIKTPYSCPGSSCMDPHTSKCSLVCNCPCSLN